MGTTINKNNEEIKIRIPSKVKEKFKKLCSKELTSMSNKLKGFIFSELKKEENEN